MIFNMLRFYREVYRDNQFRVSGARNRWKDYYLFLRNEWLRLRERKLIQQNYSEDHDILFIVSVPRSGSTLLSQLICQALEVGYISNFVARYWSAPLVGMQRANHQMTNLSLSSDLGNTSGQYDPHEFGYFWQYWFHHTDTDELSDDEIGDLPWKEVKEELNSIAGYWKKPLVIKSIVHTNFKIRKLAQVFPNSKFLFIRREPQFVMQSILQSRIKRYGSPEVWWSIRPREVQHLQSRSVSEQIAHQVHLTKTRIEAQLAELPPDRKLAITYEQLVENPSTIISKVSHLLKVEQRQEWKEPPPLTSTNEVRIAPETFENLRKAYADCEREYGPGKKIN